MSTLLKLSDNQVVLLGFGSTVYQWNGTPLSLSSKQLEDSETIGEVGCLYEWQSNPDCCGPFYAVAQIISCTDSGLKFWAGGSWLHITSWAREHNFYIGWPTVRLYTDLNTVRQIAEGKHGAAL